MSLVLGLVSLMDCCRAAGTDGTVTASGFIGVAVGAGLGLLRWISSSSYTRHSYPVVGIYRSET